MKFHIFLIMLLSGATLFGQTSTQSPGAMNGYSILDWLYNKSDLIIFPVDNWGFNGTVSYLNLPAGSVSTIYNGIVLTDPLYGQMPMTWFNVRHHQMNYDKNSRAVALLPVFSDSGESISGFDYYRGDWAFLDFTLFMKGWINRNTQWRFVGENSAYDGIYGIFGFNPSNIGESVSQLFQFDARTSRNHLPDGQTGWTYDVGAVYQKFMPGWFKQTLEFVSNGVQHLNWSHGGSFKEYRTGMSFIAHNGNASDSTTIGAQVSAFIYRCHPTDEQYYFDATAHQYSGIVTKIIARKENRLTFSLTPLVQSVYFVQSVYSPRFTNQKQSLLSGSIAFERTFIRSNLALTAGFANREPTGQIRLSRRILPTINSSWRINVIASVSKNYSMYPVSFQTNIAGEQVKQLDKEGFSYFNADLAADIQTRLLKTITQFGYVNSEFYIPFQNNLTDTTIQFIENHLKTILITEDLTIRLPWKMTLRTTTTLLPFADKNKFLQFQSWGQILQNIDLFHGNLKTYISGELTYQSGGKQLAWFEELRAVGNTGSVYYTNEKLNFNFRFGGYISRFHIFYAIYNTEGRYFSSLAKMPYRDQLKIFGVEWSFID